MKKKLYINKKKRYLNKKLNTNSNIRLSIFRSNKYLYTQLIDDTNGNTFYSFSTLTSSNLLKKFFNTSKKLKSFFLGKVLRNAINKLCINKILFDKGKRSYKGLIKTLADGINQK